MRDLLYNEVGFSWFSFNLSSRVLPLEGSSDRVRGYCYSYTSLWRGLSKFDSQNLNLGVSPEFLSADMSAGRARPFPTTISLAWLVQPWQQLNFSPCPAVQSGSRCQSGGEEEEGCWAWLCCLNKSLWLEAVSLCKLVLGLFNTGSEVFSSDLNLCCTNSAGLNLLAFIY